MALEMLFLAEALLLRAGRPKRDHEFGGGRESDGGLIFILNVGLFGDEDRLSVKEKEIGVRLGIFSKHLIRRWLYLFHYPYATHRTLLRIDNGISFLLLEGPYFGLLR